MSLQNELVFTKIYGFSSKMTVSLFRIFSRWREDCAIDTTKFSKMFGIFHVPSFSARKFPVDNENRIKN